MSVASNFRKLQGLCRVYMGIIGYILGFYWDNGKSNGNYYNGAI